MNFKTVFIPVIGHYSCPEWGRFAAQDDCGDVFIYENRPTEKEHGIYKVKEGSFMKVGYLPANTIRSVINIEIS